MIDGGIATQRHIRAVELNATVGGQCRAVKRKIPCDTVPIALQFELGTCIDGGVTQISTRAPTRKNKFAAIYGRRPGVNRPSAQRYWLVYVDLIGANRP